MTQRTAGEVARFLGCAIEGDPAAPLRGVASADRAEAADLIYLESERHVERASHSAARCAIVSPAMRIPGKTLLFALQPKLAFARAAAWLVSPEPIARGIHPSAIIAPSASLAPDVAVGPFAVIEDDVSIGSGTEIGAFCFLGRGAKLAEGCRLYPRVVLYA